MGVYDGIILLRHWQSNPKYSVTGFPAGVSPVDYVKTQVGGHGCDVNGELSFLIY